MSSWKGPRARRWKVFHTPRFKLRDPLVLPKRGINYDEYQLEINPCIEPNGKCYFEEHITIKNGDIISVNYYTI